MRIRISQVRLKLDDYRLPLERIAARALRVKESELTEVRLARKSVDARDKGDVHFTLTLDVTLPRMPHPLPRNAEVLSEGETRGEAPSFLPSLSPSPAACPTKNSPPAANDDFFALISGGKIDTRKAAARNRPVVVGMGPAGLFAGLALARMGARPVVIERGKPVEARAKDVEAFWNGGVFDPASNVQFGEGGAGAFSDGKLNSGIKDARCRRVLEAFVGAGAPEEILWEAKPHIGTDRLRGAVRGLREQILALGGEVRFETRLVGLETEGGRVTGARVTGPAGEETIPTDHVILAVGHSARDTFEWLHAMGLAMSPKPFAIGARVEHSQRMIDISQYGPAAAHPALGAADYKLSVHLPGGRSVYTFCMCPGGQVVAAASEEGGVVTNGMSLFARDGENANSALLVNVTPEDFGGDDPLAGVRFQRKWERAAFAAGGGDYRAPAQRVGDFMARRPSEGPGKVKPSYRPGVKWGSVDACLPAFVTDAMREALPLLDRKLKGFADPDAVLTAVETRSSSPVRIERDAACVSVTLRGLYPCGEGAGYAGGIMSAAVDGLRCAEAVLADLQNDESETER